MADQFNQVGNGLSFGTVLFLIFLTLKLTHVIGWSWWWISAPLWVPIAVGAAFFLIFAIVAVASIVIADLWTK